MPKVDTVRLNGAAIERARRAKLLTIGDVYKRARQSSMTFWNCRAGRPIGYRAARAIARVLGVSLASLVVVEVNVSSMDEPTEPAALLRTG
jgi:hypothetical protein